MTQHFGTALRRPWALVKWNAGSAPGRRPCTTVAYLSDAEHGGFLGGLVEYYRHREEPSARWHFRYKHPRAFSAADVVAFFPNAKGRDNGPSRAQIRALKRSVPKNPTEEEV